MLLDTYMVGSTPESLYRNGFSRFNGILPDKTIEQAHKEVRAQFPMHAQDHLEAEETFKLNFPIVFSLRQHVMQCVENLLGCSGILSLQNQLVVREHGAIPYELFHIDGNRMITGRKWSDMPLFQVIAGVPLVDLKFNTGALEVKGGGHWDIARFITLNWDEISAFDSPHDGFQQVFSHANTILDSRNLTIGTDIGDFYVLHALLPHRVCKNYGPRRPVWYFRLGVPGLKGKAAFETPFPKDDWPRFQNLISH